jgi:hypothetical protein
MSDAIEKLREMIKDAYADIYKPDVYDLLDQIEAELKAKDETIARRDNTIKNLDRLNAAKDEEINRLKMKIKRLQPVIRSDDLRSEGAT